MLAMCYRMWLAIENDVREAEDGSDSEGVVNVQ